MINTYVYCKMKRKKKITTIPVITELQNIFPVMRNFTSVLLTIITLSICHLLVAQSVFYINRKRGKNKNKTEEEQKGKR